MTTFGPYPNGGDTGPATAAYHGDFFASQLRAIAKPIVPRLDAELLDDVRNHSDPAVREHALFEYVYRHDRAAFSVVLKSWEGEKDKAVRQSLFEELTRLDKHAFQRFLESHGIPNDAHALAVAAYKVDPGKRRAKTTPHETFDQVLPLRLSLRAYVEVEPGTWMYHILAPIQATRVVGRLYACSSVQTRARYTVMTKHLDGLHSDGTLHLENTGFYGRSLRRGQSSGAFSSVALVRVPFYVSGRIGDQSEGLIPDATTALERGETNDLAPDIVIDGAPAVNNVTGFMHAWGYTRPDRATFDAAGRMDQIAGLLHPGSLLDPRTSAYVNTYTIGTYRGALIPDDDGLIPLNTNRSYTTQFGEIDRNGDGIPDEPGYQYDICPGVFPVSHYTSRKS